MGVFRRNAKKLVVKAVDLMIDEQQINSTDTFLVSYPKSGNTWLRFLVAHYFCKYYDLRINANWFTVQDLIPDVDAFKRIPPSNLISGHYGSRLLKTHNDYCHDYKRAVLLVRRPEDAISSCYGYFKLNGLIDQKMPFSEFLENHPMGLKGWVRHTSSWLENYSVGSIMRFYTFESLREDTGKVLSQIIELLGLDVIDEYIDYATDMSSLEKMAVSESRHRSAVALRIQEERFVGEGKVGRAGTTISQEEIARIVDETSELRKIIGYT